MIEGVVNAAYEPVVVLAVQGPSGRATEIETIIDTGFNGFLTVTPALAAELELPLEGTSRATLADGSEVTFDVYDVAVLWDGQPRYVLADAAGTTPLVGMRMLDRHNLNIDVADGGRIIIQAKE
ncbi:MAG: hypothetical protein OXH93_13425 [Caldilineaceae bacterium]|nr:hypothetical protein [Caldilineaceae bacterium]